MEPKSKKRRSAVNIGFSPNFEAILRVRSSEDDTMESLAIVAELDPSSDFIGADLAGVDWRGTDRSRFVTDLEAKNESPRSPYLHSGIGIVIVAHGGLAKEYLAAVEHVTGRQAGIRAVSIEIDHDRELKQTEICEAADSVDVGRGVVVVTDMFGGSSSNLSLRAASSSDRRIIYGANLPMLIKLAKSRDIDVSEAVQAALIAGRKYIDNFVVNTASELDNPRTDVPVSSRHW